MALILSLIAFSNQAPLIRTCENTRESLQQATDPYTSQPTSPFFPSFPSLFYFFLHFQLWEKLQGNDSMESKENGMEGEDDLLRKKYIDVSCEMWMPGRQEPNSSISLPCIKRLHCNGIYNIQPYAKESNTIFFERNPHQVVIYSFQTPHN